MNRQFKVWGKYVSFSLLVVVAMLLVMALAAQAEEGPAMTSDGSKGLDDNNSPIRALAAMDKIPLLNEPVQISCTLTSFIDAPGSTAQIELPDTAKLVSGDLNWQGNLQAGEAVEFGVTAVFETQGNTSVSCRVHNQLDAENSAGDLATVYLNVGATRSLEGFAPVPEKAQIEMGVQTEPGDGTLVRETPAQWQWNDSERSVPPPPSVEPSLTAKAPSTNNSEVVQGSLTVTGKWSYYDRDNSHVGVLEQLVEIVRGDNSAHLAWCYTNLSGDYSCGPFTNPGGVGVRSIIHSYASYNPNPDKLIVKNPDWAGTAPDASFRFQTGISIFADGTQSIGAWSVPNGNNNERAYWSQRDLQDTWRFIYFNGDVSGSTPGPSTVLWKIDSTDGAYYSHGGEVHLKGEDPLSDTVVIHEYSHNIMYTVYGNTIPPAPNCSPHYVQGTSSTGCAWVEGWAEFIPSVVNNDPTYRWASGASQNLENPTWPTAGWDDGDGVEGRVAGALWDIYDSNNEGDDQYTEPADFAPFWDIFYNQNDNTMYQHWLAWLAYGYNNSSAGPLMSMYQSTINYRTGPANDDFANRITVGSLPYTVNNLNTANATTQGNDPSHPCGSIATPKQSRSVWYQFTPGSSARYNFNTNGSNYDTVLSLWTGSFGSLSNVACDDDGGTGLQSSMDVNLNGGTPYYIEVLRFGDNSGGLMNLSISELPPVCYTLTTGVNPAGSGSINVSPPTNCTGGKYTDGTSVTLTAVEDNVNYQFSSWSGDIGGGNALASPLVVSMNQDRNITANFAGQANFTATPETGIAPLLVNFTNTSTGGYTTCLWTFGDGGTSNVCNDPSHTYNAPGMYSVTLDIDGPGGPDSITYTDLITVYEPVVADFSGTPTEGPVPHKVNFTNLSSGDYDTCLWEFGDGSTSTDCNDPSYTYPTGGIFTVMLTVSGPGGSDSKTITDYITVGKPTASFSGTPTSGVAPLMVDFTNTSTGEISSCLWTFGDGGSSSDCNNPSHTYTTPGVYSVTLAVDGPAGSDSVTQTDLITVYEPVVADFSASPTGGAKPLVVNFTNLSTGDYDTCAWEFGDGGTSTDCNDPSHTYTTAGIFPVRLTVSGLGGSDSKVIADYIVVDVPVADFSGTPMSGTVPLTVAFTNLSNGIYNSCTWSFGDGTTSNDCADPSHTYTVPGVYDVSLMVSGPAGSDTKSMNAYITVEPQLVYLPVVLK